MQKSDNQYMGYTAGELVVGGVACILLLGFIFGIFIIITIFTHHKKSEDQAVNRNLFIVQSPSSSESTPPDGDLGVINVFTDQKTTANTGGWGSTSDLNSDIK